LLGAEGREEIGREGGADKVVGEGRIMKGQWEKASISC